MIYTYTDKLYKKYSLLIVRAFNSLNRELQALDFDELNTQKAYKTVNDKVTKVYKKIYDELIDLLILLALDAFEQGCDKVIEKKGDKIKYYVGKKDGFRKEMTFDARKYVTEYLGKANYVTKYIFNNEYERKLARTVEAILTSENKAGMKKELDKALKYWNIQAKQTGDNVTIDAYKEGFLAAGVKYVKWVTQRDKKVCADCDSKDGKIFEIDKILIPLHYNCRCYFVPYVK